MSKKRKDINFSKREIDRPKAENASRQEFIPSELSAAEAKLQSLMKEHKALLKQKQALIDQLATRLKELNEKKGVIPDLTEILATSQGDLMNILHNAKSGRNKR